MAASAAPQTEMAQAVLVVKAQAYDCLAQIEHYQRELQRLNQQLAALLAQRDAQTIPGPEAP